MNTNYKQLTHEEDLEGKIIKKVIFTDEKCVIHFHNDEFCIIKSSGYDYQYTELSTDKFSFEVTSSSIFRLKNYGFMSADEYKTLQKEFEVKETEKKEADERRLYERLKNKFA